VATVLHYARDAAAFLAMALGWAFAIYVTKRAGKPDRHDK